MQPWEVSHSWAQLAQALPTFHHEALSCSPCQSRSDDAARFLVVSAELWPCFPGQAPRVLGCVLCMHVRSVLSDSLQPHGVLPTSSSVCGTLQARILEWVAISYCRGSFQPRDLTCVFGASFVSCIGRLILYPWVTWEAVTFEQNSVAPARPLSLNFLRVKASSKLLLPNTSGMSVERMNRSILL